MSLEAEIQKKIDLKTKPIGSLGKLEKIALQIGKIQQTVRPQLTNPSIIVCAADHGLTEAGVSPFPKEVTFQMVMNFVGGGAAINVFSKQNGIKLQVADAGVDYDFPADLPILHKKVARGTKNILNAPAMTAEECEKAMKAGAEIVREENRQGCNIIGFGEMGIGNTSAAALLMHKYTGIPVEDCTGRGTGHDDEGMKRKIAVLKEAAVKHAPTTPEEILATYGGLEIAMISGGMLEAQKLGMMIMVDGFIATSAFMAAWKMNPSIKENAIFCHLSDESGHKRMLAHMEAEPLLSLGMRLGEGTGAAVAYPVIKSAVQFINEMASFEDAGVSNKD